MKQKILLELQKRLKKSRFEHTLSVRDTAIKIAKACNEDEYKCEIAALFHDYAKNLSHLELTEYIKKYELNLDDVVLSNLYLAHGMVASDIAKRNYGIVDDEILEAIWYHTIGRENMSKIAKIIYISDYIEPTRPMKGIDKIMDIALNGELDRALLMVINHQLDYLLTKNTVIHINSLLMRNELINLGIKS